MSETQRLMALERAQAVRKSMALLRRQIANGEITVKDAVVHKDLRTMRVSELVLRQPGYGETRLRQILKAAANHLDQAFPLNGEKTLGTLSDRQKAALVQACRETSPGGHKLVERRAA